MDWQDYLKEKCRKMGCRCKIRNRGKKLYARVMDWNDPNAIQGILEAIKEDYPDAMITSGRLPYNYEIVKGALDGRKSGDVTFRLNP